MAWTGTATVKRISDTEFRITGLSLAGDASGTIGFSDKTSAAEVSLVAPTWQPYVSAIAGSVSLQDAIKVDVDIVSDVDDVVPISVVKTGTTHADFVITCHNDTAGTASADLEIWVTFHD